MRFAFVAKHRTIWPVSWLCKALDVSSSGFHDWLNRKSAKRTLENESLLGIIRTSLQNNDRTCGARGLWRDVLAEGMSCGLHRIERLMRKNALKARPRRRTLPSDTGLARCPCHCAKHSGQAIPRCGPNRKWIADFTYVWTVAGWRCAMGLEMGGVDHQLAGFAAFGCQACKDLAEHAQAAPADEAITDRLVRAILSRSVAPAQTCELRR